MKLLHLTFHKGCELDIEYVFSKLGHDLSVMQFDDGETDLILHVRYEITHDKAQKCWNKYADYFNTFDGIITSDTCPNSRVFLQNNWKKLLIIWICNRFDYAIQPEYRDPEFYQLLRDIPNRPNTYIFGNTRIESLYCEQIKNVKISDFVIKPLGKNLISENMVQTYENGSEVFYVPPYHNETKLMDLSAKLTSLGIPNKCERFPNHISDLLEYKGGIYMPYAWSTIVFFERLQLGLVTFIPTIRFLMQLFSKGDGWFQPPFHPKQPENLQLSEWYCPEHKDIFVFFDSWEDLVDKVKTTNYKEMTQKVLDFAKKHEIETLSRWKSIIDDYTTRNNISNSMIYYNYLDRRTNTFKKSYDLILENMKNKKGTYNIVELGSSRSFVNGGIEGCMNPDIKYWEPNNPDVWDWGAGIFTKVFAENLKGKNYKLYTVDPDPHVNTIVTAMSSEYDEVSIHLDYSTNFLNNFDGKIDFLYMDHMDDVNAAYQHLFDAQLLIEKDLMSENGIILIDDIGHNVNVGAKGEYSIPYLVNNNYKKILHEYQVLMVREPK